MKKKMVFYKIIAIIAIISLTFGTDFLCYAGENQNDNEKEVVKVAYFDLNDYYNDTNGKIYSYDSAYLDKVEEYSNLVFEYVDCGTWSKALKMLKNHEVDLVGTVQWNEEREREYEFCLQQYGYTYGEFAVSPEKEFVFEDYDAIGESVIGCTGDYIHRPDMDNLLKEHNIAPQIKTYDTQSELQEALDTGEIDIIAANSHTILDGYPVVERFCYTPYFFVSWKGNNRLTDQIDQAETQIALYEQEYVDRIINEYLPELLYSPLTKAELDCISKNKTYTIYFDANTKPLVWTNKDGEFEGVLIDICKELENKTGLHFNFEERSEKPDDNEENPLSVDYHTFISNYNSVLNAGTSEEGYSAALLNDFFSIYHKVGTEFDENGAYRIGVPAHRSGAIEYLSAEYPNCRIVEFDSPTECLNELSKGKIDLVFLCGTVADTAIIENNIQNVAFLHSTMLSMGIGLQFHGDDAQLLASIVNKGMAMIPVEDINKIELRYALDVRHELTIPYLINQNPGAAVVIAIVIALITLAFGLFITHNIIIKREKIKIEEANKAKTDFFSRMSHDMRTPMNGILGMVELSEDEKDISVMQQNMGKIKDSGKYLLGLINDTLDFQKIESGKLELEPAVVDSKQIVAGIVDIIKPAAKKKKIDFRVINKNADLNSYIRIDALRMKQVFINLLSNAIKFTPEGGTIEFEFELLSRDGMISHDRIYVRDTGIGMSEDFVKNKLFKPFCQEHNEVTDVYAGTGLGLSIVRKLVELMGGKIEVESELGVGTTFIIDIDFERVDYDKLSDGNNTIKSQFEEIGKALKGRQILLAEDHPLNAEISKKLLEKAGCKVVCVKDGEQCLKTFSNSDEYYFDAILMDIRMPNMNGLEATEKIRLLEREDAKTVPIIAMTANAYASDIQDCTRVGMNAHISKPIDTQIMYNTIIENLVRK